MSYFQRLGDMNYMAEEAEMVDFVDEIDGGAAAGVEDVEANEYDLVFFSTYFFGSFGIYFFYGWVFYFR